MVCKQCGEREAYKDGLCSLCYYSQPPKNPLTGKAYDRLVRRVKGILWRMTDEGQYMSREYSKTRKARKESIVETYTKEEWNAKKESTGGICPCCKKKVGISKLAKDHIIPLCKSRKGQIYTINDVQPLCKICNSKKGRKVIKYL